MSTPYYLVTLDDLMRGSNGQLLGTRACGSGGIQFFQHENNFSAETLLLIAEMPECYAVVSSDEECPLSLRQFIEKYKEWV